MTDISTIMRAAHDTDDGIGVTVDDCNDAADEIDKLRARLATIADRLAEGLDYFGEAQDKNTEAVQAFGRAVEGLNE